MAADAPTPTPTPPKRNKTARDLLLTLAPLILICLGLAGLARACDFSPGKPAVDGTVPTVDEPAELRKAAGRVDFPIRSPQLPDGWRANSAGTERVGEGKPDAVRIGLLTPGGHYLRLSQSTATVADLVRFETGQAPQERRSLLIDSVVWDGYQSQRNELAHVTQAGGVQLLITGSGTEDEVRELAKRTMDAPIAEPVKR